MAGAKAYKKAPFMIADDVVAYLKDSRVFSMTEVVKPGFINLKVKGEFLADYLKEMCIRDSGTGVWYHFYGNGQSGNNDSIVYVSKVSVLTGVESAATNRFAGVVEPQETVSVKIESGRKVKEVQVKTGDEVKACLLYTSGRF